MRENTKMTSGALRTAAIMVMTWVLPWCGGLNVAAGFVSGKACPEDLTGDDAVGGADLGTMLAAWGPCDDPEDCPEDLTGNGVVGGEDLGTLLAAWGPCPDLKPTCGDPEAGDCCIPGDTPACNDVWCCEAVCAVDPFCCDIQWDIICVGHACDKCATCGQACHLPCGDPLAGDCCTSGYSPSCDDEACCELICDQDPFCCDLQWNEYCADQANELCEICE